MQKKITFRGMEYSKAIESYADEQLAKIINFLENEPTPIHLELIIEAGRPHAHHRVELFVKTPHYDFVTHDEGPEAYKMLTSVIDKMYRNLHEKKREVIDKRNRGNSDKRT